MATTSPVFIPHDPQTDPRVGDIRYSWRRYTEVVDRNGESLTIVDQYGRIAPVTTDEWAHGTTDDYKRHLLRTGEAFRTPFRKGDIVRTLKGYNAPPFDIGVVVSTDTDTFTDLRERLSVQPCLVLWDGRLLEQDTAPYFIQQSWIAHTGRSLCASVSEWLPLCDDGSGRALKGDVDQCSFDSFDPWVGRHFVWPADAAGVNSQAKEGDE